MSTLLVKNISYLATFDDAAREIRDGALLVRDNVIEAVGTMAEFEGVVADRVLDLSGHIVMPGMVNIHHHMYQNLTRVMVQDDELLVWLKTLYPIWSALDDHAIGVSARVAMAELIASGCTTSSDHLYILPNNCTLDATIDAASDLGLRFHAARGAMSRGQSQGGLPPDNCVEREEDILKDAERLIHRLSRQFPPLDEPHHPRAMLAVLGNPGPDEGRGGACPWPQGRPPAFASWPKTSSRKTIATMSTACARWALPNPSAGLGRMSGSRIRSS
jgi:cytosine/adenosine deaminase-related metal-dependent hydrolase